MPTNERVAFLMEFADVGAAQYDAVMEKLKLKGPMPGGLLHIAGPLENGWCVMDVWESGEAADAFYSGTLMPILKELGVPAIPPKVIPVHNMLM